MQRGEAKIIVYYYTAIPDMLKEFRRQRQDIEDEYYNSIRGINTDGMPHGTNPGRPTESLGVLAADNDAGGRLKEIETRIGVLERDRDLIRDSIDSLNGKYKKLLLFRYQHDYSWTKISFRMKASDSTVRYWHDMALDRLAYALEDVPMVDEILLRASRARK